MRLEFLLGEYFIAVNAEQWQWLFTLARWACVPFSLIGGYLCFYWGRELYGPGAGLLALALWCFCPNILGHGALITPDVAATSLGLAACYTFWHWLRQPNWWHTVVSGLTLGVAELAKMTLVIFFPLWIFMWLVYRWPQHRAMGRRDWLRELGMLAVRMLLALYVLNLGYAFEGSFTRLGDFKFVSAALGAEGDAERAPAGGGNRFEGTWLGALPVPVPKNYLLGIDLQKLDFEHYHTPSYLRGQFRDKGWWYYYLYALAIKVPLGTWLLFALAATRGLWSRAPSPQPSPAGRGSEAAPHPSSLSPACSPLAPRSSSLPITWRDEFVLLCPAAVILAFVSSQTGFSEHMRYVLPAFPFVFVWIGRIVPALWPASFTPRPSALDPSAPAPRPSPKGRGSWRRRIVTIMAATALIWSIGSSLSVYPHSLSYFNELVGGPKGGPAHLIHSNIDWGQDLLFLKKWLDKHPEARPISLFYFGYFDPKYAGIEYTVPEELLARERPQPVAAADIPPGWYAVSVNFVRGLPYFIYKGDGTKAGLPQNALTAFQQLEPVAMAGYSIYIYRVP